MIKQPPIKDVTITKIGQFTTSWVFWFQEVWRLLSGNRPFPLQSFTVSGVPTASEFEGHIIYVSNETGGKTIAFSDGTNWRRVQDRAVIS